MAQIVSAGILIFREFKTVQVYLCHMGGPFWEKKDEGAWGIPKGIVEPDEQLIDAAIRECQEETGVIVQKESLIPLKPLTIKNSKIIHAWAYEVDSSLEINLVSNTFELEWPKNSGIFQVFPEIDKAQWFPIEIALTKIIPSQRELCIQLLEKLSL
jgi:predicted NUDIX family NTP pyrophosphohydrolase